MKTMKKYLKVVLCFVAFAVCSILLAFSPTLTAQAALDYTLASYNVAINSIKMPTTEVDISKGDKLTIPLLKANAFNGGTPDYIVRVIDPSGNPCEYAVRDGAENDDTYFDDSVDGEITVKVLSEGTYKIVYIINETVGSGDDAKTTSYYSNVYEVKVTNVALQLDFAIRSGDKAGLVNLVPTESALNNTITLPVASVKETVSGNYVEDAVVNVRVLKNGEEAGDDYNKTENTLTFTEEGVYTIEYSYSTLSPKVYQVNVDSDFVASELELMANPTMPKVELGQLGVKLPKLSFKAGNKENVNVNVLKVRIEKESNSSIYYEIKNNDLDFDMTVENFANVENYSDMQGNYRVTYFVEDANGKQTEKTFKISSVSINSKPSVYMSYNYELDSNGNVVDASKVNTDAATELKVRYGYEEVVVPAIYATDLITQYKDLKLVRYLVKADTKQVFYVDNIMEDGTIVTAENNKLGYNYAANNTENTVGQYNRAVAFKFTESAPTKEELQELAGTYYLEYRVVSNNVKTRNNTLYVSGTTQYSFVVDGDYAELPSTYHTTPKVEITNVRNNSYINNETEVKVTMTAKDEVGADEKDGIYTDSRLKNVVFYYYGDVTDSLKDDIAQAIVTARADASFKNECNVLDSEAFVNAMLANYTGFTKAEATKTANSYVAKITSGAEPKATIVAVSLNDYDEVNIDTKVLNVKVTEKDSVAPEYTIDKASSNLTFTSDVDEFAQGAEVILPTVNFTDKNDLGTSGDSSLQLSVAYYVENPESKSAGLQYRYPSGKTYGVNSINGGKIITSEVGTYVVVYSATDAAGNTSVVFFSFEVYDSSKPVLSVEAIGDNLTQSGNTITAEKGALISFETLLKSADGKTTYTEDYTISLDVKENAENLDYRPSGFGDKSFYFNSVGSYTIIVNGSYTDAHGKRDANEKRIELTIKAPSVKWNAVENIQTYADTNEDVYLPDLTTTYANSVVSVSVKTSTGAIITPTKDRATGQWKFKTNSTSGKYTITYSATFDDAGISISDKTYTLKVGDMTPPSIKLGAGVEANLRQEIVYDGTNQIEYLIKINKDNKTLNITAKSNGTTIYSYDTGLKLTDDQSSEYYVWDNLDVKLTSSDGIVEKGSESGQYFIKGKGNYTITLSTTDRVGNDSKELTIDFKVVTQSEVEEKNDTIVGAVLIVISLVVLAGVILFFTFTGRKGGSKKVKKAKKAKTEATETEVVVEEDATVVEEVKSETEDKE